MRKVLALLGVVLVALLAVSVGYASNGGDDGTNQCGPYTNFNLGAQYQQHGYQSPGNAVYPPGWPSASANIRLAGYNANGSDYTQSWTGGWDELASGDSSEWLQAGIGAGSVAGISQSTPYLFVEVHGGTVPGIGYVAENHYKLGNAGVGATYTVTVHGANNQYYVTAGGIRYPSASGSYISYSESLINSSAYAQFTTEEITQGGACPWAEFQFSSMNDNGVYDGFNYPSDQAWWLLRGSTSNSYDEWGNDCIFWSPPCSMPVASPALVQSPVTFPSSAARFTTGP
jgi:ABC-type antimicrobial peptide transport system permease subunit